MEDSMPYFLACFYMTYTEEHDRLLSNIRSEHDPTEAIVDYGCRKYSDRYAINCRKYLYNLYPQFKKAWNEEIRKHNNYSAQHWIDEYERLTNDGWNIKGYRNHDLFAVFDNEGLI